MPLSRAAALLPKRRLHKTGGVCALQPCDGAVNQDVDEAVHMRLGWGAGLCLAGRVFPRSPHTPLTSTACHRMSAPAPMAHGTHRPIKISPFRSLHFFCPFFHQINVTLFFEAKCLFFFLPVSTLLYLLKQVFLQSQLHNLIIILFPEHMGRTFWNNNNIFIIFTDSHTLSFTPFQD